MKRLNKVKLRKLKVGQTIYLWKRAHYHLEEYTHSECAEVVRIFLDGHKQSFVEIHFREEDNQLIQSDDIHGEWKVGYPDAGVIWFSKTGKTAIQGENDTCIQVNLNSPVTILSLIEYCIEIGWNPKNDRLPLKIENALELLDKMKIASKQ